MHACYGRQFPGVESPLLPWGMEMTEFVLSLPIGPPCLLTASLLGSAIILTFP